MLGMLGENLNRTLEAYLKTAWSLLNFTSREKSKNQYGKNKESNNNFSGNSNNLWRIVFSNELF